MLAKRRAAVVGAVMAVGFVGALVTGTRSAQASSPFVVPAGKVTVLQGAGTPEPPLPAPPPSAFPGAELRGYGFSAAITGLECAPTIGTGSNEVTAPAGDEVCALRVPVDFQQPNDALDVTMQTYEPTAAISDLGLTAPITDPELDRSGSAEYAMSVPAGSQATFSISNAGFTQSYSLTARDHVGSAPAVLYRAAGSWEDATLPGTQVTLSERGADGDVASVQVTLSGLELTYFWPPKPTETAPNSSQAFVMASFGTTDEPGAKGETYGDFEPLQASHVNLRTPAGLLPSQRVSSGGFDLLTDGYIFTVPADFSKGTLWVTPGSDLGSEAPTSGSNHYENVSFGNGGIPIGGGVGGGPPSGGGGGSGVTTTTTSRPTGRGSPSTTVAPGRRPGTTLANHGTTPRRGKTKRPKGGRGHSRAGGGTTAPGQGTSAPRSQSSSPAGHRRATPATGGRVVEGIVLLAAGVVAVPVFFVVVVPFLWRRRQRRRGPYSQDAGGARLEEVRLPPIPVARASTAQGPETASTPRGEEIESSPSSDIGDTTVGAMGSAPDDKPWPYFAFLGPAEILHLELPIKRLAVLELLFCLAAHNDRRLARDEIVEALRPADETAKSPITTSTFHSYISTARRTIGPRAFPHAIGGTYALSPEVRSDWQDFQDLVATAAATEGEKGRRLLSQALGLVRGPAFAGIPEGYYGWAHRGLVNDIARAIVAAASDFADRCVADEAPTEALEPLRRAWLATFDDVVAADLLSAAGATGDLGDFERTWSDLCHQCPDAERRLRRSYEAIRRSLVAEAEQRWAGADDLGTPSSMSQRPRAFGSADGKAPPGAPEHEPEPQPMAAP